MNKLNQKGSDFPMKVKDIPKFEIVNIGLRINVLEINSTVSTPIHINKNYLQPQIDSNIVSKSLLSKNKDALFIK